MDNADRKLTLDTILSGADAKFNTPNDYQMLNIEQVKVLSNNGVSIQSHSSTHSIASKLTDKDFEHEVIQSCQKIMDWTQRPVSYFAYPNGSQADFNNHSKKILRQNGITAAFTLIRGTNDAHTDPYEMKRIPVKQCTLPMFLSYLLQYI